jgi:hypothetical protein
MEIETDRIVYIFKGQAAKACPDAGPSMTNIFFRSVACHNGTEICVRALTFAREPSQRTCRSVLFPRTLSIIRAEVFDDFSLQFAAFESEPSVREIQTGAFRESPLRSFCIPQTVEHIGDFCFSSCPELRSLFFSANSRPRSIGHCAFRGTSFVTFALPASVTMMDGSAFKSSHLTFFNLTPTNPTFCLVGGSLLSADCTRLVRFVGTVSEIEIEAPVTVLGPYCFAGMLELKRVEVAVDCLVSRFERSAFCGTGIRDIVIPNTVLVIGDRCFAKCYELEPVCFEEPARVTKIGSCAFYECEMWEFCLPASVNDLVPSADEESAPPPSFWGFTVQEFTVESENEAYEMDGRHLIRKDGKSEVAFFVW